MTKKFKKTSLIILFTIFFGLMPTYALFANDNDIKFNPNIKGIDIKTTDYSEATFITDYISALYKYGIGIIAILATVVMMYGGVVWITAMGNNERIANAKAWIGASLSGLILALSSYVILYIVNPNLVDLHPISIPEAEKIKQSTIYGCCKLKNGNTFNVDGHQSCDEKNENVEKFYPNQISYNNQCITKEQKYKIDQQQAQGMLCGEKLDLGYGTFMCGTKCDTDGYKCTQLVPESLDCATMQCIPDH